MRPKIFTAQLKTLTTFYEFAATTLLMEFPLIRENVFGSLTYGPVCTHKTLNFTCFPVQQ
jgi:hypothetical protein